ncbi:MAG: DUF4160 domain-containing protein [Chloroflexi bacterium]|nr:DUF4160 domain-containing protein [Chloroflexota bacterium]
MPTMLRVEGFRFFFFSNELQEPPHVHVERGDGYAKLWLDPIILAYSERLTRAELRRLRELTAEHEGLFLEQWHAYFGR